MTVRPMQTDDIPAVAETHVAAWQAAFRGILPDAVLDNLTQEEFVGIWQEIIERPNRTNLVVEEDGRAVGFVAYGPVSGGELGQSAVAAATEIYGIYTHPRCWRSGVGGKLLEAVIALVKPAGINRIVLWTMTENAVSRGFYEKYGFGLSGKTRRSRRYEKEFEEVEFVRLV